MEEIFWVVMEKQDFRKKSHVFLKNLSRIFWSNMILMEIIFEWHAVLQTKNCLLARFMEKHMFEWRNVSSLKVFL